jgi:hypothetical protein
MRNEAASAGFYHSDAGTEIFRAAILTIEELLNGKEVPLPPNMRTFKQAEKFTKTTTIEGFRSMT